ncbi:MAG: HXXEE domain-containing protein, partial [Terracidiphilus sp.]
MPFRRMQWLFPVAVTLHNGEEAVFLPSWVSDHRGQIPLHPSSAAIWVALLLLTAGAYAITALSAKHGRQSVWAYLL